MLRAQAVLAGLTVSALSVGGGIAVADAASTKAPTPPSFPAPTASPFAAPQRSVQENLGRSLVEEAKKAPQPTKPNRSTARLTPTATKFKGRLTAAQARKMIVENAPSLGVSNQLIPPTAKIHRILNDHTLQLDGPRGEGTQVMESSLPVASRESGSAKSSGAKYRIADIGWESTGDRFQLTRPVADVTLPKTAGGLTRFENGTTLHLAPTDSTATGVASGEAVTYANTDTDTDTIVRSLPTGIAVGWSLRSPEAQRELRLPLDLADGQHLSEGTAGEVSVRDEAGAQVMVISPATAVDADQQPVPLSTKVDGDTVTYDVDHAAGKVAYPVTVDPEVYATRWNDGSSTDISGWFMQNTPEPSAPYQPIYPNGQQGSILGLYGPAGYYAQNESTAWGRFPPGNPAVPRGPSSGHARWTQFTAGSVGYTIAPTQNYHYYNYASGQIFIADSGGNIQNTVGQLPAPTSGANYTLNASGAGLAVDNVIGFGLTLGPLFFQYDHPASIINLGYFQAVADDPTKPGIPTVAGFENWLKADATVSVSGADNGLGINGLSLQTASGAGVPGSGVGVDCGTKIATQVCPFNASGTLSVNGAAEGIATHYAVASDAGGNIERKDFTLKIDRSAPEVALTGALYAQRTAPIGVTEDRQLVIDAADGVPGGTPAQQRTGVARIDIYVDDNLRLSTPQSAAGDSQSLQATYTLPAGTTAAGTHTIRVVTADRLGNERTSSFDVTKSATPDADAPDAAIAGELADLAEGYVPRARPVGVTMTADDPSSGPDLGAGIRSVGVEIDGQSVLAQTLPCNAIDDDGHCGDYAEVPGTVDFATYAEGTHAVQGTATDDQGNTSRTTAWTVSVDRTPPAAATSLTAERDPATNTTQVSWGGDDDPDLSGTTVPGSGAASWSSRFQRIGGAWSDWTTTDKPMTTIPNTLLPGELIAVEVKTTDGAGNESAVASLSGSIVDQPTDPVQISVTRTDGSSDDPATTRSTARRAATFCGEDFEAPTRIDFSGEVGIAITGQGKIGCAKDVGPYRYKICLEHQSGGSWDALECRTLNRAGTTTVNLTAICLAGTSESYRIHSELFIYSPKRELISDTNGYSAVRQRDCNEPGAWRHVSIVNSQSRSPRENLKTNLKAGFNPGSGTNTGDLDPLPDEGTPPANGQHGWTGHHIVAIGRTTREYTDGMAYAYACGIPPNGAMNGIWLRGPALQPGRTYYNRLTAAQKKRALHSDTNTLSYGALVSRRLRPFVNADGTCKNAADMRYELRSGLRAGLKNGTLP